MHLATMHVHVSTLPSPPGQTTLFYAGEGEGSYFHSSKLVTTAACNVQTIGRDVLYTPRIETRLKTGAHAWPAVCCCWWQPKSATAKNT